MSKKTFFIILLATWIASNALASEERNKINATSVFTLNTQITDPNFSFEPSPPLFPDKQSSKFLFAQASTDVLSNTTLASDVTKKKDTFYFVNAGAAIPIYDSTFKDFLDYGASVNVGVGKKVTSDLTITTSIGVVMMTGKWSTSGDPRSLSVVAESRSIAQPGGITAEGTSPSTGDSILVQGESLVTSSANLETVDVDTTLYLFPIRLDALYQFKDIGKIKPYAGGGIGFCLADRKCESKALVTKYFDGPEYGIKIDQSQTVTGMLLDLVFGFIVPFKNDMRIVGEVNTSFYDLTDFDPILEVFYKKTSPAPFTASDITTFSYQDPQKIGVFNNVVITNISIGLIVPF